ncbi:MAG: hypothetical protein ACI4LH_07960 [Candidatus Heritagella sp.]
MNTALLCGRAKVCITPPPALLPNLRGLGNQKLSPLSGEELYARALALQTGERTVLLLSCELDKVPWPRETLSAMESACGVPRDRILLFSTHIHAAPVIGDRPDEPVNDERKKEPAVRQACRQYGGFLREKLCEAAKAAVKDLRPARLCWGRGESAININRFEDRPIQTENGEPGVVTMVGVNPAGITDREIFVIKVETPEGTPLAFFLNYAVHNVTMICNRSNGDDALRISSDLAGEVCQKLEQQYPGAVVLWSSGAAGDLNPLLHNGLEEKTIPAGLAETEYAEYAKTAMAARHLADVERVIGSLSGGLPQIPLLQNQVDWCHVPGRICTRQPDGRFHIETGAHVPTYDVREHLVKIGPLVLCAFSGELFASTGLSIKRLLPGEEVIVINHDCSLMANSGYIFEDDLIRRIEHSAVHMHIPGYDEESHLLPGYIVPALLRLTENLHRRAAEETAD